MSLAPLFPRGSWEFHFDGLARVRGEWQADRLRRSRRRGALSVLAGPVGASQRPISWSIAIWLARAFATPKLLGVRRISQEERTRSQRYGGSPSR